MLVRHSLTKDFAWSISLRHCGGRPVADRAGAAAEVAVEVRAYLVAVEPGPADVLKRRLDVVVGEIADVGGAPRVVRRVVQALLRLGQQIQPGEEERHARVVLLGEFQEAREEAVADLARPVPGKDHELRRGLAGLQRPGLPGCWGCLPVKEVEPSPMGRAGRPRPLLPPAAVSGTPGRTAGAVSQCGAAARESHRGRGAGPEPQHSPSTDVAHSVPIRRALCPCRMDTALEGTTNSRFPATRTYFGDIKKMNL